MVNSLAWTLSLLDEGAGPVPEAVVPAAVVVAPSVRTPGGHPVVKAKKKEALSQAR